MQCNCIHDSASVFAGMARVATKLLWQWPGRAWPVRERLMVAGGADNDLALGRFNFWFASHGLLIDANAPFGLFRCACEIAILELRQHFFGEKLNGRAQQIVRDLSCLRDAEHLIDAGLLEIAQALAQHGGRTNAILYTALGRRELLGVVLVLVPKVGPSRPVLAEKTVVAESVNKESVAFRADLLHAILIAIAQERRGDREVGIDSVAEGLAFVFDYFVIVLHPLAGFVRRHKGKRQRAHAEPGGLQDGVAVGTCHP